MPVSFKFESNSKEVNAKLSNMVAVQMPFAISKALNDTAATMVAKNMQDIPRIFNNAVPWTIKAFGSSKLKHGPVNKKGTRVTKADVKSGHAHIYVRRKDQVTKRHYLDVQEEGGTRENTGLETLVNLNLPTSRFVGSVTPTPHLKRNKSGAMSGGELNKIMSALHLSRDTSTHSKRYGYTGKTKRSTGYFVPAPTHPLGQGKRFGVYRRNSVGNAKKVLNISERRPIYKPKFRFDERMTRYGKMVFPKKMQKALIYALSTAKLR